MEVFYINSSLLFISQSPINYSLGETTEYEECKHMPALFLWYLILQVINMLLGIPANILVLWLIHKSKGESSTSDIFILHLAVLDIFFCLTIPLELANKVYLTPSSTWYALRFIYGVKDSSPIFLCCVCLDRYMAVLHPITFSGLKKDRHHRAVLVSVVWLVTLAYSVAKGADAIVNSYRVFTAMILAAFAFMAFCNIAILWALGQSGPGRDERHPVKKRAFKMVLIILAIIIFNYFPPVALFPFKHYFSPDVFRCYIHYIAFGLMDFSSTIQPLLYLSKERLPRGCSLCCQSNPESQN